MTLHADLLRQARFLAQREPKRPRQASLRRAVSGAYYALFHLLVDEATRPMFSGQGRASIRPIAGRAFHHATMKALARQFATRGEPAKLGPALNGQPVQPALADFANTFQDLQQARHEADYDLSRRFTRLEVRAFIALAERAFDDWRAVRGSLQADTFLAGLLTYDRIRGSR